MNLLEQHNEPDATGYLSASTPQKTLPVLSGLSTVAVQSP